MTTYFPELAKIDAKYDEKRRQASREEMREAGAAEKREDRESYV